MSTVKVSVRKGGGETPKTVVELWMDEGEAQATREHGSLSTEASAAIQEALGEHLSGPRYRANRLVTPPGGRP